MKQAPSADERRPLDVPEDVRVVSAEEAGARLDVFLAGMPSVLSRARARRALQSGKVTVQAGPVGPEAAGWPLAAGAEVKVRWNLPGTSAARSRASATLASRALSVLYEDAYVLAIDKPAGLLTDAATKQQRREHESVRSLAKAYLAAQKRHAVVVHRLDRDTSGVVLLATSRVAAEPLLEQFRRHEPDRIYWAIVQGGPDDDAGEWEDRVVWDAKRLVQRVAHPKERDAKPAHASWRVLARGEDTCWLEVRLRTGRRNQIRLQAQLRGYPLVGERLYTDAGWTQRGPEAPRQALHARRLVVRHPDTGARLALESELPDDLAPLFAPLQGGG